MADEHIKPEDAYKAIVRASQRKPQISAVRERIETMSKEERGLEMLVQAIRKLMRQD